MFTYLAKYATGLFYVVGGPLIHGYMMTQQRALYDTVDDTAWSFYQTLWTQIVLPNLLPLVIVLVALEVVAGLFMLNRNPDQARLGQAAGLLFNLLLVPFWFFYAIPNLLLVALHFWLLKMEPIAPHQALRPSYRER
jgi:hypothetical protein